MDDNKRHMWQMAMSPDPIALTIREKTEQYFPGRQPLRLRRAAYAPFGRLALAPLSAEDSFYFPSALFPSSQLYESHPNRPE